MAQWQDARVYAAALRVRVLEEAQAILDGFPYTNFVHDVILPTSTFARGRQRPLSGMDVMPLPG